MKLKKLFALALAGVMTLALLTGCGDKPEDTLRAEALADIINVQRSVNITCKADPQLNEAAQRYTHVSSGEGSTPLINDLTNAFVSKGSQARKALLDTIGIAPGTANKQVIFYYGEDRGSDDPVKQAIDLCNVYRQVLPEPDENTWHKPGFLASSYRVGFGRWKDENGKPRLFVIMVGDIPERG
ncbi:hypothetical protein [Faecalibacterium prausnitzii]|uniref:hypothetical protein n=1 Tax=Faecalibacterium prausnitzii TaxID=853 RepID=UPI00130D54D5|nr:hypothetical protein [Faecalibacterium prausnitzii]